MIKDIIFFDDEYLYGKCETKAVEHGLRTGNDFVVFSLQKYFEKIGQKSDWKKSSIMWRTCKIEANKLEVTVPEFIEAICHEAVGDPMPEPYLPMTPDQVKENQRSLRQRISDLLSLPVGK